MILLLSFDYSSVSRAEKRSVGLNLLTSCSPFMQYSSPQYSSQYSSLVQYSSDGAVSPPYINTYICTPPEPSLDVILNCLSSAMATFTKPGPLCTTKRSVSAA